VYHITHRSVSLSLWKYFTIGDPMAMESNAFDSPSPRCNINPSPPASDEEDAITVVLCLRLILLLLLLLLLHFLFERGAANVAREEQKAIFH
jgi:hypothetical protein